MQGLGSQLLIQCLPPTLQSAVEHRTCLGFRELIGGESKRAASRIFIFFAYEVQPMLSRYWAGGGSFVKSRLSIIVNKAAVLKCNLFRSGPTLPVLTWEA